MNIISLCDRTGNMVKPWAEAGYACVCYDWQHSIRRDRVKQYASGGSIAYRWADVRGLTLDDLPAGLYAAAFAFPDCTNGALSGARDFERKGIQGAIDYLVLIEACRKLCCCMDCPWMIEQPMSRLSTIWRKPDHTFSPWQYGDGYQKETWLWTGGGFVMPQPMLATKPKGTTEAIWKMPPSSERKNLRAITPMGFARAVFAANHPRIQERAA
jgi:hypothetical protein